MIILGVISALLIVAPVVFRAYVTLVCGSTIVMIKRDRCVSDLFLTTLLQFANRRQQSCGEIQRLCLGQANRRAFFVFLDFQYNSVCLVPSVHLIVPDLDASMNNFDIILHCAYPFRNVLHFVWRRALIAIWGQTTFS